MACIELRRQQQPEGRRLRTLGKLAACVSIELRIVCLTLLPCCSMPRRAQVMSKYGALWQHMFRLRRVQLALEGAWATLQVRWGRAAQAQAGCSAGAPCTCVLADQQLL